MNFTKKELGLLYLGLILFTLSLGMSYLNAQSVGGPQPTATIVPQTTATIAPYNAAGYQATPVPTPDHHQKNLMTDNKIPNEGVPPGKPLDGEIPTITMVPVGTVETTPAAH
jgi:hypothetical protein